MRTLKEELNSQHKKIEVLLDELVETYGEDPKVFKIRENLLTKLLGELVPFLTTTEDVLYEKLKNKGVDITTFMNDQRNIYREIKRLYDLSYDDPNWKAKAKTLKFLVEKHFRCEETKVLSLYKDTVPETDRLPLLKRFEQEKENSENFTVEGYPTQKIFQLENRIESNRSGYI